MTDKTVLNPVHRELGARMVPFGGWDMPLHYGSQIREHHAVRQAAGMFDVSHMLVLDLEGERTRECLRHLLANDVARLTTSGKALYSCMLNEAGGVIDDLITYYLSDTGYRTVVNAATANSDLEWIERQAAPFGIRITARRDLAMIAVQGPEARTRTLPLLPESLRDRAGALKPFTAVSGDDWFVARTGYTGEDGFEVMLPASGAQDFWRALAGAGVKSCGLGARDTLRLEAGMNLYGTDMDDEVTPLESGLAWTVAFDPANRDFIGRSTLERQRKAGGLRRFVGLVLEGRGVLRNHQALFDGDRRVGEITSGGFSPTLDRSIALARVAADCPETLAVDVRGKRLPVRVVKPPFVRHGKPLVDIPD